MQAHSDQPGGSPKKPWIGKYEIAIALYSVRAFLILIWAIWCRIPLGGPEQDASGMVWIPFLVADFPWSIAFEHFTYPTNEIALVIYMFTIGLPWLLYGWVIQRIFAWLNR